MKTPPFFHLLPLLAGLWLLCSCSGRDKNAIELYVGVYEDASAFMDWEDALYYKISSTRKINGPEGASIKASFGKKDEENGVSLDLIVKDSWEEVYTIEGTYKSKVPFTITFLGTNSESEIENQISFRPGTGRVSFKGKLLATYEKEKKQQSVKKP